MQCDVTDPAVTTNVLAIQAITGRLADWSAVYTFSFLWAVPVCIRPRSKPILIRNEFENYEITLIFDYRNS